MQVGSFGDLVFRVSDSEVFTLRDFQRRRAAQFAEHAVLSGLARLQFLGVALAEVEFKIQLSRSFTDVEARLAQVDAMIEAGEHHALVAAGRKLGRFVILESQEAVKHMASVIVTAELSLKLKEYN